MKERYHVTGMSCSACSSHVEKAVNKLENVEKASVNLLTETMDVTYDETKITSTEIIDAVVKAGYGASVMTEGSAAGAGGRSTSGNAGSTGRSAADGKQELQQKLDADARAMKWRLGISIGFLIPLMYVSMHHMFKEWFGIPVPAFIVNTLHGNANAMNFALTQFLLLLPILYVNRKFFSVGFKTLAHRSPNMDSLIAMGSGAALVYGIFAMYRISYGLGYGDMAVVEHYSHDLYFESSGTILTLITVGKYLESRSKGKTSEAITKLMNLAPKVAILVTEDGQEKEVPTESLQKGDVFLVKPGSLVPVDGIVLEGNSSVDEAAITGESVPVEKQAGDHVVSATVNKAGFLKCRADRVGDDTTLAQIIRLVEEASASKAPIAQLADKVAGVFVPTVMAISLVTLIVWLASGATAEFAISTAIAVLVISCPCALGLATPVAIMVGTGVGASNGILIKTGEALQQAKEIDTVVLDKTGTITSGKLKVEEAGGYQSDFPVDAMMQIAAALEKKSEHPLAEAVVEYAESFRLTIPEITDFQATFGRGVEGALAQDFAAQEFLKKDGPTAVFYAGKFDEKNTGNSVGTENGTKDAATMTKESSESAELSQRKTILPAGTKFYVGNLAFLQEKNIILPEGALDALNRMADEGMTPLLVAMDVNFQEVNFREGGSQEACIQKTWPKETGFLGIIGVADTVKATSYEAIQAWEKMGVKVIMLTGDNRRTAEAVREKLGISEVVAEVLPQDKEEKVSELKRQGHKVAMIGDGINDAPALAAADVGMAIGAGTDVAMESADIILMKNDLRDAVTAMKLSRAVIRNIKENLFWAFFYNCIGIPLAAGVLYPAFQIRLNPMFGAAAMSLSSIFVVGNALRLRGFKSGFTPLKKGVPEVTRKEIEITHAAAEGEQCILKTPAEQNNRQDVKQEKERTNTMTKVISIEGMMCNHCTGTVQKALEAVEGVKAVTMSLEQKNATVELASDVADDVLAKAVTDAGYEVKGVTAK
ncbi:heavy metal translocating P-type ATPase [Simiaoa sunii]|uniref:Copper-exporting P-type ATPase n=1 Tax=Simiaoa sunii TaxID=2763672 RepID=A0A7G9FYM3_9FIRM|nr:heavy metal translocating P-type ATPase [Simiaoa sunii]QNM03655.1 heavy metal translocating P-type ATPase [Simiaoa sunii]